MSSDPRIQDILEYADIAQQVVAEDPELEDTTRRLAVERALFLIGEAANHMDPDIRASIDQPWQDIIALRHLLAHQYQTVRPGRLAEVVRDHLPSLVAALETS